MGNVKRVDAGTLNAKRGGGGGGRRIVFDDVHVWAYSSSHMEKKKIYHFK